MGSAQDRMVEEEKKQRPLTTKELQQYRDEIVNSKKPLKEIIDSARLGVYDYDFNSLKLITGGK